MASSPTRSRQFQNDPLPKFQHARLLIDLDEARFHESLFLHFEQLRRVATIDAKAAPGLEAGDHLVFWSACEGIRSSAAPLSVLPIPSVSAAFRPCGDVSRTSASSSEDAATIRRPGRGCLS